ncbi:protein inscuteable homolog [Oppia nitens]|uniref:protein inscuteable homolog n=1 Tax=Oppia nitens TaxID=1686743 RepID=UPI0023DCE724|nr:protein inscuteable homolog [Oppia nitens]
MPMSGNTLKLIKSNYWQTYCEIQTIVDICERKFVNNTKYMNKLIESVYRTASLTNKLIDIFIAKKCVNNSQLESTVRKLKELFGELINQWIKNECKVIIDSLYKRTVKPLIEIINNYWLISLDSTPEEQQIKVIALRVLTILCINRKAVKQLINECTYSQFLTSLITNESSELILREAIDLMLQLTKQLIDKSKTSGVNVSPVKHIAHQSEDPFPQFVINDFIYCLTKVIEEAKNAKIILLICATFANMSFVDIESIVNSNALNVILGNPIVADDIFIRDQIITILANIARKFPLEIVSSGGLIYIINSLQLRYEDMEEEQQLLALERIQQKVSVAIARLANSASVTQIFFRLNAVKRLIDLCKIPEERNFNDNVLIACMAALKSLKYRDLYCN